MPNRNLTQRVAREVRAEMARQGLSSAFVASRIEMGLNTFYRSCRGERSFQISELELLARVLNVPVITLLREALRQEAAA